MRVKAVLLFANIGIAGAYLKEVGVDVVVANEFVEKRAGLYQKTCARQAENPMLNEL